MLFSPAFLPGLMTPGGGAPPADPDEWLTSNLLWSIDPDDEDNRTIVSSGGTDYVRRLTAPQNGTWYAENTDNASAPVLESKDGRGVMSFNGANRRLFLTAEFIAQFGQPRAPHTLHVVRYLPGSHNGQWQTAIGIFLANSATGRHIYEFDAAHRMAANFDSPDGSATGYGLATESLNSQSPDVPLLLTWRVDAVGLIEFFVDGVHQGLNWASMPDYTLNTNGMGGAIGANVKANVTEGWLQGSIGAMLWYGEAHDDSTISAMVAIKNARYT